MAEALLAADGMAAYGAIVEALGAPSLPERLFDALGRLASIDEIFAFTRPDRGAKPRMLASAGIGRQAGARAAAYRERFHGLDPLNRALMAGGASQLAVRVAPDEIADASYREACFEAPRFVEKLSIARRGRQGWTILSLYRGRRAGRFSASELERLSGVCQLALPLLARHGELAAPVEDDPLTRLDLRLGVLCPALTTRERAVLARTAIGMTAEAAALDLGIKPSSVLTYRRRGYERLGISSGYQLLGRLL
jgi:DNA-binding CsgD family transcriptional regulator